MLKEKYEALKRLDNELKKAEKNKTVLKDQITKAVEVDDDTIDELNRQVDELKNTIQRITAEREAVMEEIEAEETKLEEVTTKTQNTNTKEFNNMEYLQTKQAAIDFMAILKKGMSAEDTRKAWERSLEEKNISPTNFMLPGTVVKAINDAFTEDREIFETFNHTGLKVLAEGFNTTSNGNERARGHKKGETKNEEVITLTKKELRAQLVYKYLTIDRETILEQDDDNALLKYIATEMPKMYYKEVARAAAIGDGRASDSDDKITKIEAMTAANSLFKTEIATTSDFYADLINAGAAITAGGRRYAIMSRTALAGLQLAKDTAGHYIFAPGTDLAAMIGVEKIFTPDWATAVGAPKAIIYVGEAYKTVGRASLDSYENFILSKNANEYLVEGYVGGGLMAPKSAAIIKSGVSA